MATDTHTAPLKEANVVLCLPFDTRVSLTSRRTSSGVGKIWKLDCYGAVGIYANDCCKMEMEQDKKAAWAREEAPCRDSVTTIDNALVRVMYHHK